MQRRRVHMVIIVALAVLLGALREFLAINLNYQIDAVRYDRSVSYAHSAFQQLVAGRDLRELIRVKWLIALAFSMAMCLLCLALARSLNGDQRHRKAIIAGFLIIGCLALLFHLASAFAPPLQAASIKLLHLLQYPVVLFFVWAGSRLQSKGL